MDGAMTPEKDPWNKNRRPGEGDGERHGHGLLLWLVVVGGVIGLVWFLLAAFPQRSLETADWVQVVKLGLILTVAASSLLFIRRLPLGETLRNIGIWAVIAGVLAVGYAYRDDFAGIGNRLSGELLPSRPVETGDGAVVLRAGAGGHFVVTAEVDGRPVDFLVDTGASDIVLSPADAERLGFRLDQLTFNRQYSTANGIGRGASVRLGSLAVGPIVFNDVPASVNEAPMGDSLLGMSFLRRLGSYEVRGDRLILRP